jgi:HEAT repeat protein
MTNLKSQISNLLLICFVAIAPASAQTTQSTRDQLDFGADGLNIPPIVVVNGHTPRTAQLLGDAYRKHDPLLWKRVQLVGELGQTGLLDAEPFLMGAMKDAAPEVRAQAARSAAMIERPSGALLANVEKLIADPEPAVRGESVLAAAKIARAQGKQCNAVDHGLADRDTLVVAAAIRSASTLQQATQIARQLASLPADLQIEAAAAIARVHATELAPSLRPMLDGDITQRIAALRALRDLGNTALVDAIAAKLADPHPTVRREALLTFGKLAPGIQREHRGIQMLADTDPTVRESAVIVLTPAPSPQAIAALAAQLDVAYRPLHAAVRQALTSPADASVRDASINLATDLLTNANLRRREDASLVLGNLRSHASFERHVSLLEWDAKDPKQTDWRLVAQAAESLGLIADARAVDPLMILAKSAPDALADLKQPQLNAASGAMANAIVSLARLHHRDVLPEARRILQIDPQRCPRDIRAASAFAVGILADPGKPPGINLLGVYDSIYEAHEAKFEALKALGNLRLPTASDRLKEISSTESTPDLRWIAHWSYEHCSGKTAPYSAPAERREPPVSITHLSR